MAREPATRRATVTVRVYQELNDFLPPPLRGSSFPAEIRNGCTVKALIEDLGVPHTEVDLVLLDGESVGFEERLADGGRLSVYPVFESWDIGSLSRVRPEPLREVRFLLDVHLGRLAGLLRMTGMDAAFPHGNGACADRDLARMAREEGRILLTRDRGLLKRSEVTHGYCIRSALPREQLRETLRRFDLAGRLRPFTRCMADNAVLRPLPAAEAAGQVPERVARERTVFSRCPSCGRIYWRGTHWQSMKRAIEEALSPG